MGSGGNGAGSGGTGLGPGGSGAGSVDGLVVSGKCTGGTEIVADCAGGVIFEGPVGGGGFTGGTGWGPGERMAGPGGNGATGDNGPGAGGSWAGGGMAAGGFKDAAEDAGGAAGVEATWAKGVEIKPASMVTTRAERRRRIFMVWFCARRGRGAFQGDDQGTALITLTGVPSRFFTVPPISSLL